MTETVEAPVAAKAPKRVAAQLLLFVNGSETGLKAIKYPMPLKAPRFALLINGEERAAAQTTFRDIKYTYFEFNGASFYVPGHVDKEAECIFSFPEGYEFKPMKLDRKEQAAKAAASKAAKSPAPEGAEQAAAGEESPPEGAIQTTEGDSTSEPVEAAAAPAKKGKKASR